MSMDMSVEKNLETRVSMDTSDRLYLEMGVTGPIVRTRQLHDPSHRDERDTCLPLSMD